jgi:bifunctional non-homologous end joining protein LigD
VTRRLSVEAALARLDADGAARLRRAAHPDRVEAQLATLSADHGISAGWLFERKLDGMRLLLHREGDRVRLRTRRHDDRTRGFPELVEAALEQVPEDVVLDGEVVAFEGNVTSFARLQGRLGLDDPVRARATGIAVHLYLFDLLHVDGRDVRGLALRDRKRLLRALVGFEDPLRFTPHRLGSGRELLDDACGRGWEGLIAKKASAPYASGRSRRWLKLKCSRGQELVVGGWTAPRGTRHGFGSLLLGHYEGGRLRYAGRVGTGFDARTLTGLSRHLARLERDTPPFVDPPRLRDVRWAEPELVAEIAFTEWTRDGRLRHPRFKGVRTDKDPGTVVRESP